MKGLLRSTALTSSQVTRSLSVVRVVTPRKRTISTTSRRWRPTNVGGIGLAAKDASVGEQAPEPLTIEGIKSRRLKAGKLVAGTAANSDSDMFKSPHAFKNPKARRWDHLLSAESLARKPCVLKEAAKHLKKPGLVSLGGGLPSADHFPFDSMSLRIPCPPHFSETATHASGRDVTIGKRDVAEKDGVFDLSIGLNYGQSIGSAQMLRWVTEHTELCHRPPYADWRSALTIGSTGSLECAYRMFCDRNRGDSVLTEEFSFSTALETAEPLGIRVFGVKMDEQGLLPESMDDILSNWNVSERGARKPTVLYTVPSGQNPTGATQGVQRRKDVYAVCQKHDMIIIEDEPYYFLQMQKYTGADTPDVPPPANVEEFLSGLIPSLLSIDVDGRVMRHDSFSKVVVPGSRMGWITASEQIIERYIRHAESCSQGPSGFSQLAMYKLIDEEWGHEGYLQWLMHLRLEYTKRRNIILGACEKYLPRDVVSWVAPAAGMFTNTQQLWLKVDHTKHPDVSRKSLIDIEEEIFDSCIEKGVLACRGSWFLAEHDKPLTSLFFRTTFASASEEQMEVAIERFGSPVVLKLKDGNITKDSYYHWRHWGAGTRILTRNTTSDHAVELAKIPYVELVLSNREHGYDLAAFSDAAKRSHAGIRLFEISVRAGVKHLMFSGLDYNGKETNYADEFYVGHYEGKARVQEWIHAQGPDCPMDWTIIRSGPYADMLSELFQPRITPESKAVFALPLGADGQMPFVSLSDFEQYVDWALSNPVESKGLDFGIAIEHADLKELAAAYTGATGKPATYEAIDIDDWHKVAWENLPDGPRHKGRLSIGEGPRGPEHDI
ncbi:aromatic amino acid aminotransferase [Seiridium cupressi]